nr:hypothetical protein 11 [bacterium]
MKKMNLNSIRFVLISILFFALFIVNKNAISQEMMFLCKGYSIKRIDIRNSDNPLKIRPNPSEYSWKISINKRSVNFYRNNEWQKRIPIAPETGPRELDDGTMDFSFKAAYIYFYDFRYFPPPHKSVLHEMMSYPGSGLVLINYYFCE